MIYNKMSDAALSINTHVKNISDAIVRNHKCGGFIWERAALIDKIQ